jgi:hypothetical protein
MHDRLRDYVDDIYSEVGQHIQKRKPRFVGATARAAGGGHMRTRS